MGPDLRMYADKLEELYKYMLQIIKSGKKDRTDFVQLLNCADQWIEWGDLRTDAAKAMQSSANKRLKAAQAAEAALEEGEDIE